MSSTINPRSEARIVRLRRELNRTSGPAKFRHRANLADSLYAVGMLKESATEWEVAANEAPTWLDHVSCLYSAAEARKSLLEFGNARSLLVRMLGRENLILLLRDEHFLLLGRAMHALADCVAEQGEWFELEAEKLLADPDFHSDRVSFLGGFRVMDRRQREISHINKEIRLPKPVSVDQLGAAIGEVEKFKPRMIRWQRKDSLIRSLYDLSISILSFPAGDARSPELADQLLRVRQCSCVSMLRNGDFGRAIREISLVIDSWEIDKLSWQWGTRERLANAYCLRSNLWGVLNDDQRSEADFDRGLQLLGAKSSVPAIRNLIRGYIIRADAAKNRVDALRNYAAAKSLLFRLGRVEALADVYARLAHWQPDGPDREKWLVRSVMCHTVQRAYVSDDDLLKVDACIRRGLVELYRSVCASRNYETFAAALTVFSDEAGQTFRLSKALAKSEAKFDEEVLLLTRNFMRIRSVLCDQSYGTVHVLFLGLIDGWDFWAYFDTSDAVGGHLSIGCKERIEVGASEGNAPHSQNVLPPKFASQVIRQKISGGPKCNVVLFPCSKSMFEMSWMRERLVISRRLRGDRHIFLGDCAKIVVGVVGVGKRDLANLRLQPESKIISNKFKSAGCELIENASAFAPALSSPEVGAFHIAAHAPTMPSPAQRRHPKLMVRDQPLDMRKLQSAAAKSIPLVGMIGSCGSAIPVRGGAADAGSVSAGFLNSGVRFVIASVRDLRNTEMWSAYEQDILDAVCRSSATNNGWSIAAALWDTETGWRRKERTGSGLEQNFKADNFVIMELF